MKYKLPRQVYTQEMSRIVAGQMRKQKLYARTLSVEQLQQLSEVTQTILEDELPKHLVCKKLPGDLGKGIFLHPEAKPILKGQMIAPYAGELSFVSQSVMDDSPYAFELMDKILLTKEEQAHFDPKHSYHPKRQYCLHVDALKKGNFIRFINHSDTPNVIAHTCKIPANSLGLSESPLEVIYFAQKIIRPGEQLLVCYEGDDKSYWSALEIEPLPMTPKTLQLNSSLKVISS